MRKKKQDFLLSSVYRNILYYQNMVHKNTNPVQKEYYTNLLNREKLWMDYLREEKGLAVSNNSVINNIGTNDASIDTPNTNTMAQRTFTVDELAVFNGEGGNPPYVAVNGIVYDLSSKPVWRLGNHFGLKAGKDLTSEFQRCHQGIMTRLQQLPQVGTLIQ